MHSLGEDQTVSPGMKPQGCLLMIFLMTWHESCVLLGRSRAVGSEVSLSLGDKEERRAYDWYRVGAAGLSDRVPRLCHRNQLGTQEI